MIFFLTINFYIYFFISCVFFVFLFFLFFWSLKIVTDRKQALLELLKSAPIKPLKSIIIYVMIRKDADELAGFLQVLFFSLFLSFCLFQNTTNFSVFVRPTLPKNLISDMGMYIYICIYCRANSSMPKAITAVNHQRSVKEYKIGL